MCAWSSGITCPGDLVTGVDLARRGFLLDALERRDRTSRHIDAARHLRSLLEGVADSSLVWTALRTKRKALLAASGLSDRFPGRLALPEREGIPDNMPERHLLPSGDGFREELTYRYLLAHAGAFEGGMRNLGETLGKRMVTEKLASALGTSGIKATFDRGTTPDDHAAVRSISWKGEKGARSLWLDKTVPQTGTSVGFVLVKGRATGGRLPSGAGSYLAVGEMKAGIDLSAADERWKAANSALDRLRRTFGAAPPRVFFVGAAISPGIAEEIYDQLVSRKLNHAANFLVDDQLSALCEWLVSL